MTTQRIQYAYTALQRGDKAAARRWAEAAVAATPGWEEAWLALAAVSSHPANISYYERALRINPNNARARHGLALARQAAVRAAPLQSAKSSIWKSLLLGAAGFMLALTLFVVLGVGGILWLQPEFMFQRPNSTGWAYSNLPKPLPSISPSATPQPTATPQATATHQPTEPPAEIPGVEPTINPVVGNTYIVQPGDTLNKIAAYLGLEPFTLIAYNNLENPSSIMAGQQLSIPDASYVPPTPEPVEAPTSDKRVLVDISEQHMYVYEGETLVYSFIVSTGMNNSTRVGTFQVLNKIPNAYGANWNIWMPNWLGIYWSGSLQNGIHALPILPNGATLWDGYLGTPISYGCVVLGSYEAQLLYDWVEVGTPVIIQW